MAFHSRLGGRSCAPANRPTRDSRSLIRGHLRRAGKTTKHDLARWWNMSGNSAHRRMSESDRVLSPAHIAAVVAGLQLTAEESTELYRTAAIEAGFKINVSLGFG